MNNLEKTGSASGCSDVVDEVLLQRAEIKARAGIPAARATFADAPLVR